MITSLSKDKPCSERAQEIFPPCNIEARAGTAHAPSSRLKYKDDLRWPHIGHLRAITMLVNYTTVIVTRHWPYGYGGESGRVKTHTHTNILSSHVYVPKVLCGVLYPKAHNNGFEKKKKTMRSNKLEMQSEKNHQWDLHDHHNINQSRTTVSKRNDIRKSNGSKSNRLVNSCGLLRGSVLFPGQSISWRPSKSH
jgi:hypothetical protein